MNGGAKQCALLLALLISCRQGLAAINLPVDNGESFLSAVQNVQVPKDTSVHSPHGVLSGHAVSKNKDRVLEKTGSKSQRQSQGVQTKRDVIQVTTKDSLVMLRKANAELSAQLVLTTRELKAAQAAQSKIVVRQNDASHMQASSLQRTILSLQKDLESRLAQLTSMQTTLSQAQQQSAAWQKKAEALKLLTIAPEKLKNQLAEANAALAQAQTHNKTLSLQFTQLQTSAQQQNEAQATARRVWQHMLSALQTRLDVLSLHSKSALSQQQETSNQLNQTRNTVQTLTAQLQRVQTSLTLQTARANQLDNRLKEFQNYPKQPEQIQQVPSTAEKKLADDVTTLKKQLAATSKDNVELKGQIAALSQAHVTDQQSQTQTTPALEPVPVMVEQSERKQKLDINLTSTIAQQSYASGVMMAGILKQAIALQTDLGDKPDMQAMLIGVQDGVGGQLRLKETALKKQYNTLVERLSSKEKARFDSGVKRLEMLTANKKVLKRNGTLFFVQNRKGKRALAVNEKLKVTLRESTLEGRVLSEQKAVDVTYSESLPYLLQQALQLGQSDGNVDVYCFASDVYSPTDMPEGVFAYTLMKYSVSTSGTKID